MPNPKIATARFVPIADDIPKPLRAIVAKMGYNPLQKIALTALHENLRYHCCNKCLVCAAVVELIERTAFMEYEPDYVKMIIEG